MLGARLMASAQTRRRIFTASGTFTVPAGITTLYATCVGAGGTGGNGATGAGGGGGSAGGAIYGSAPVTPGASVPISISGAGGGGSSVQVGVDLMTASVGNSGDPASPGVPGGANPGGGTSVSGVWTQIAQSNGTTASAGTLSAGGNGASRTAFRGISGTAGAGGGAAANGAAATGYGAGGGGGGPGTTTGGAGAPGLVILEW